MFFYRFRLFIKRYTNFQKRLYLFTNLYGSLLRKILEILKYFQYTKIYETMENVCIKSFLQNWSVSSYNNYEIVNSEDFMWG